MFCKLLINNYKAENNSEIANFLENFLIPNWRNKIYFHIV